MFDFIQNFFFDKNPDHAKSIAYADTVLDNLHHDLNIEYWRMARVTTCYGHLFNICRIRHLCNAIDEINKLCNRLDESATLYEYEAAKKAIDDIAMQNVGSHSYEDYLLNSNSKTPYKQVLSGQGDDCLLPDIEYIFS